MVNRRGPNPLCTCLMLVGLITLPGCGGLEVNSTWRSEGITIDGVPTDWRAIFPTYVDAPNIAIRALNDDEYLYVCLSSPDRNLAAQMVTRGFTVWFDPKGGKTKALGIRYPLGRRAPPAPEKAISDRTGLEEKTAEMFRTSGEEMELLGPAEDQGTILAASGSHGVVVRPGYQGGNFVYELRIPLHYSDEHPYAIGYEAGRPIGLGFEIPELDIDEIRKAMGGDMPSGEGSGPPGGPGTRPEGGRGGGMSPGPGMHGPLSRKGFEIWTRLTLATPAES